MAMGLASVARMRGSESWPPVAASVPRCMAADFSSTMAATLGTCSSLEVAGKRK